LLRLRRGETMRHETSLRPESQTTDTPVDGNFGLSDQSARRQEDQVITEGVRSCLGKSIDDRDQQIRYCIPDVLNRPDQGDGNQNAQQAVFHGDDTFL